MIVTDTYAATEHPVIADLRTILGRAIDRRQVTILRAEIDLWESRCECCAIRPAGHGHFAAYCERCADRPLTGCDHGLGA